MKYHEYLDMSDYDFLLCCINDRYLDESELGDFAVFLEFLNIDNTDIIDELTSNLEQYLIDKHNQLIDICSMMASPEFKRMNPKQFVNDEILKSYLKKDSLVSNVLPVETQSKSLTPNEIEKIFSQGLDSNKNEDFKTQYHENLKRLKKEYGEREINSELVDEIRSKSNALQNKIFTLFQD